MQKKIILDKTTSIKAKASSDKVMQQAQTEAKIKIL